MILKVNTAQFVNLAKTVTKGVGKDLSSQLVLTVGADNTLGLSYNSASSVIAGKVPFVADNTVEPIELCISGNQLKTATSLIIVNEEALRLEIDDIMTIKVGSSEFKVPVIDAPIAKVDTATEEYGTVTGVEFIKIISELSKLLSTDSVLQNHPASCLNIISTGDKLNIVATNTFGLVEKTCDFNGEAFHVLLKPAQVGVLLNAFTPGAMVKLIHNKSRFGFYNEDDILHLVSFSNMKPLEYGVFKETAATENSFTANIEEFKYAIQAMTRLSPDSNQIWLNIKGDKIEFRNTNHDTIDVTLDADTGDNRTVVEFGAVTLNILVGYIADKIRVNYGSNRGNQILKIESLVKGTDNAYSVDDTIFITVGVSVMHVE